MLYAAAMVTGFRASELTSLAPSSFALEAEPPTVTVKAGYSKNRREAIQPLPPDVAAALRAYLAGRPAGPVWPGEVWPDRAADMLREDLRAAGIPYRDAEGRVADFHALRHSYITLLQQTGVHPKLAQELARHSDIRLTMKVYTHTRLHDLAGAVEGLPSLLPASGPGRQALAATGTEGGADPTRPSLASPLVSTADAGCLPLRTAESGQGPDGPEEGERNPFGVQAVESNCESVIAADGGKPEPARIRQKSHSNPFAPGAPGCKLFPDCAGGTGAAEQRPFSHGCPYSNGDGPKWAAGRTELLVPEQTARPPKSPA
jgi:hypothetical protein